MKFQHKAIAIALSDANGSICGLEDLRRGIRYAQVGEDAFHAAFFPPFRLDFGHGMVDVSATMTECKAAPDNSGVSCTWRTPDGMTVQGNIKMLEDELQFTCELINGTEQTVRAIEYPIFPGIRRIAGHGKDYLAHSYGTGILIRDPYTHFTYNNIGLRYMPYPESFSGCAAQFFTYYGEGKGGLYFAAYDSGYHLKWLNFYNMRMALEASHICGSEDIRPGKGIRQAYPFVVRFTDGKGWYEAADLYRAWALAQPWCARGPLYQLPEDQKSTWLLEKAGLCTFGINGMYDRTLWLKRYHKDLGTPIFHVLGPDWTNEPQTFGYGVPGGMNDWVPTRFSKENLDTIKAQGDYVAPFEFDFLVDLGKDDSQRLQKNLMHFPPDTMGFDDYHFRILCPASPFTKEFHRERDLKVLQESGVDSMYYDISANNLIMSCLDDSHGHPVGGTVAVNKGFIDVYLDTKAALAKEKGRYVPVGTELINEIFLTSLDYYQARSWGQPSSSLEFWPIRGLIITGAAEPIPLFSYTYSGYNPVRMDGWGKLVEETGAFFHMVVARVYLWGGLYEINHEYSAMECIDGQINDGMEHYFHFDPVHYAYSDKRAQYLRQFAALRVGAGNKYLAYGRMLPPPIVQAEAAHLDYYHYNHGQGDASYQASGTVTINPVLASAYESMEDGSIGVFLANTDEATIATVYLSGQTGLQGQWNASLLAGFDPDHEPHVQTLGKIAMEEPLTLALSARAPVLLILTPAV